MKNIKYVLIIFLIFLCFNSGMCPEVIDQGEVNMPEIIQIGHNWCWAASMKAVLAVSDTNVTQCDLAHWLFNLSDCCSNPTPFYCDESATASQQKQILDHWGFDSTLVTSSLSWNDLKKEIKAGRPINIGWQWCTLGGHSLNIYGFRQVKNSSIEQNVMYMDSANGQGYNVADYEWLIGQCPGQHTWYRTLYNIRKRQERFP